MNNFIWRNPSKTEQRELEYINVYPGEAFRVWLNKNSYNKEREAVQIEVRVTTDGRIEIFTDEHVNKWDDWSLLPLPKEETK